MNRQELAAWLTETYSTTGEYLFARYPSFQVFRHHGNKKWFAVIMDIPRKNLGLPGEGEISVVNLKGNESDKGISQTRMVDTT